MKLLLLGMILDPNEKRMKQNFTSTPEYLIKLNSTISSGEDKLNPICFFLIKKELLSTE